MDLARSIQVVCEEVMLRMARTAHRLTGLENLVLAGGVALNCVANGRLLREGPFRRIWIQPAAGDAGGALGVAQLIAHRHRGHRRVLRARREDGNRDDAMHGAYLGPAFAPEEIEKFLKGVGAVYHACRREEIIAWVADLLAEGKVVGWFNGRMEFGPRSLGNRSILGDPRDPRMQSRMNLKIKFRESFRPFAPSVLRERAGDYFELDEDSPYMLLVSRVKASRCLDVDEGDGPSGLDRLAVPRSDIPAVTHVDYTARVQTVRRDVNPDFYDLIAAFEARTGCAVLVNTSFNVRGEPIVCTPRDAYTCFMRTNIDHLVLGTFLLDKMEQPSWKDSTANWQAELVLD
jgi:carbamoyltransferase